MYRKGEKMGDFAFIRNNNMKMGQVTNSYKHNERINKKYSNDTIDITKSHENYHFKEPQGTYEQAFWKIKEDNHYLGNLRLQGAKQSNVACEFIIDVNKEYFEKLGEERTRQYFKDTYDFCKDKCGEKNIISATVHLDEGHPHMHVVYVPVVKGRDRKGKECERINCSKFWEGKDSYRKLQDEFYQHTQKRGYTDLQRGEFVEDTKREHLTVDEYKAEQSKQKQAELEKLEKINTDITPQDKKVYLPKDIDNLKTLIKSANLQKKQIQGENEKLKFEVEKLTRTNSKLKEIVKHTNKLVSDNKDLKNEKKALVDYLKNNPQAREQMTNHIERIGFLQKERHSMYQYKKDYLENNSNIYNSQKIEQNLKNDIGRNEYAIKDLGQREDKINELDININLLKERRMGLNGVRNVFKGGERKELDNTLLNKENDLKIALSSLKNDYGINHKDIKDTIRLKQDNIHNLQDQLAKQGIQTENYTQASQKALINYKYLNVKRLCYKDFESEYVCADADKIKVDSFKNKTLTELSKTDRAVILKNIPEEYQNQVKGYFKIADKNANREKYENASLLERLEMVRDTNLTKPQTQTHSKGYER